MSNSNEYMREYMLKRYKARMALAIEFLGGQCVKCGSKEKLEIDHIDPKNKKFTFAKGWSAKEEKLLAELEKCQLLCCDCHYEKSCQDSGKQFVKNGKIHGTISSYRYCRCDLCKKAWSDYNKARYQQRKTRP